jgi:hypothetical protein
MVKRTYTRSEDQLCRLHLAALDPARRLSLPQTSLAPMMAATALKSPEDP